MSRSSTVTIKRETHEKITWTPRGISKKIYKFYGLQDDDAMLFDSYFPTLRNGVFLEMGALDGVKYSNTKFFEDNANWTGVLIEPLPADYEKLVKNRPRSKCYNCAVSKTVGEIELYVNDAVSSVKHNTDEGAFNSWHRDNNVHVIKVPSKRLDTILNEAGVRHIDLWSLDVEGSEYEALETMDWSISVYMIYMEMQNPDRKERCHATLRANGFTLIREYGINEVWVNPAHRRKY
jgi:FkbM family methyltransferase